MGFTFVYVTNKPRIACLLLSFTNRLTVSKINKILQISVYVMYVYFSALIIYLFQFEWTLGHNFYRQNVRTRVRNSVCKQKYHRFCRQWNPRELWTHKLFRVQSDLSNIKLWFIKSQYRFYDEAGFVCFVLLRAVFVCLFVGWSSVW